MEHHAVPFLEMPSMGRVLFLEYSPAHNLLAAACYEEEEEKTCVTVMPVTWDGDTSSDTVSVKHGLWEVDREQ